MTSGEMLLLRADANERIGTGHVLRCLALAQAWQDWGGKVTFAAADLPLTLEKRLRGEEADTVAITAAPGSLGDADQTIAMAQRLGCRWVVVDGYQLRGDYLRRLRQDAVSTLVLDDNGQRDVWPADIVLNQNLHACKSLYPHKPDESRLLLGTRYVLLRREFQRWRQWDRQFPQQAGKLLVTMGGADPDGVTLKVVHALKQMKVPKLETVVVAGPSNPHLAQIQAAARQCPGSVEVAANVVDMPGLMAWADLCIAAGGTTSWERALLSLPSVVIVLADNQRLVAESLAQAGMARNLGWHEQVDSAALVRAIEGLLADVGQRREMGQAARRHVDADGAARTLLHLAGDGLRLREVTSAEDAVLWHWANDSSVRQWSFSPEPIRWEDHLRWLAHKRSQPDCLMFVGVDEQDRLIGQVRLDPVGEKEAEVDISVDPGRRGQGWGTKLLRAAVSRAFRRGLQGIHARIREGNTPSLRAFTSAGFVAARTTQVNGGSVAHMVFSNPSGGNP